MTTYYLTIDVSKDGSHNFNAPTDHDLGTVGEFQKTITRHRLGNGRSFQLQFSTDAPFKVPILALEVMASG